jgi:DNA-binding CsgD family transcriptional regulator
VVARDLRPTRLHHIWGPVIEAELADTADSWERVAEGPAGSEHAPAHLRPYARLRWAERLAEARERAKAREVIASAFAEAEALGLILLTSRLAPLAASVGASLSTARGGGPLASLTARELEVLKLVALGRTNAQISQALFISTKTASVHVSNILAKLEVAGRGEAAAVAHREGLA